MNDDLLDLLLGISTDAIDEFDGDVVQNSYAPIFNFDVEPSGIKKYYASADGSQWERFDGEFEFGKLAHRVQTVRTDLFGTALEIHRPERESLMEKLDRDLATMMSDRMSSATGLIESELDKLLKSAVDQDTLPNLYNDSLFIGKDIDMPGAGAAAPVKFSNLGDEVARTVDGVKDAYYQAKRLFRKMKKPNGDRYHNGLSLREGIGVMYPDSLEEIVDRTFSFGRVTADENNERLTRINRENAHNMISWDEVGLSGLLFFPVNKRGRLMPLNGVRMTEALKFQSDIPEFSGLPSTYSSQQAWALQKYFIGTTMDMEVAVGSALGLVWIPLTPDTTP